MCLTDARYIKNMFYISAIRARASLQMRRLILRISTVRLHPSALINQLYANSFITKLSKGESYEKSEAS